jgi:hypothetical protein
MKEISLEMVRDHMDHLPSYSCPSDYTIRTLSGEMSGSGPKSSR